MKLSKDKKPKAPTKKRSSGKGVKVPAKARPKMKAAPKKETLAKASLSAKKTPRRAPRDAVDFRKTFMDSLVEKRNELLATLDRLMSSRREYNGHLTAGDFIDEVDDAQREISAYGHYSLIERKNRELQKIEYLIERIKKEEAGFGSCEECGQPIPRERLMVIPEATLCVACQRELEKIDQRKAMAASTFSGLGSPTRREVTWETTESSEDEDNLTIEYHIGTMPSVDIEETETESPPEEKEEK